jgi:uncharacterized repeat protein (TIGR03803 family)
LGVEREITADGAFTVLYSFQLTGWSPSSSLIQASDGNLYGTTAWGGGSSNCYASNGCGTVYKITPQGVFTALYSFNEAAGPFYLSEASDGNFYGTTSYGGPGPTATRAAAQSFNLRLEAR